VCLILASRNPAIWRPLATCGKLALAQPAQALLATSSRKQSRTECRSRPSYSSERQTWFSGIF
jgi:hypothetical protein